MSPAISNFRKLLAMILVWAFLVMPIASAQHLEEEPVSACAVEHGTVNGTSEEDNPAEHEHHVHNCHSCHIHILRYQPNREVTWRVTSTGLYPTFSDEVSSLSVSSLFRPPRV